MKILNITISYSLKSSNLYSDLNEALVEAGHSVTVLFSNPAIDKPFSIDEKNGVKVYSIKTRPIQKVGVIKKGIAFLSLPFYLRKAIKRHLLNEKFDLILFMAPPVTLSGVVAYAKKLFSCPAFLMQKDIFPQNAVDLKVFSKYSLPYLYFRYQEKRMLDVSDKIGCMSNGNIDYLRRHNPSVGTDKFLLFANSIRISDSPNTSDSASIRKKYNIPADACLFMFGGNMGIPQYLNLLVDAFKHFKNDKNVYFLCVGSGTHSGIVTKYLENEKTENAKYFSFMPRADYDLLARACDVGLVILNPNYTIPNYPSKTLSYMENSLPILAATDRNTDYRNLIEDEAKCGIWCDSSKPKEFFTAIEKLASDKKMRRDFGANGRKYLEENFTVSKSVKILEDIFCSK